MGLAMSYLRVPLSLEGVEGRSHGGETRGEPDPGRIAQSVFGEADWRKRQPAEQLVDVGPAWQALHYLITGDAWDGRPPEADVVCGGRLLTEDGAERLGMDVIYLAPQRVKAVAHHLADTPFEKVAGRFDLAAMSAAEVQDAPSMDDQARDKVLRPAYEGLTRFFAAADAEGQAVYKVMA